jgi:hypothetical protein
MSGTQERGDRRGGVEVIIPVVLVDRIGGMRVGREAYSSNRMLSICSMIPTGSDFTAMSCIIYSRSKVSYVTSDQAYSDLPTSKCRVLCSWTLLCYPYILHS